MSMRVNDDLDSFMNDTEPKTRVRKKKRRPSAVSTDAVRRRAFRLLALMSDMDSKTRDRVLRKALTLSRA
jgi:hypothetical protein